MNPRHELRLTAAIAAMTATVTILAWLFREWAL